MRRELNKRGWPALLAGLLFVSQIGFGQIIPSDRCVTWANNVGIPGGIPSRTTIYKTLTGLDATGASDVSSQIQSALNSCPSGQVVYLPAGSYKITSALTISSSITFRGAGPDKTILVGTISGRNGLVTITSGVLNGQSSSATITAGATKGSTNITIAAADSNLHPGYIMMVDQLNDGTFIINDATDPGGYQRTDTDDRGTGTRNNSQAVEVKSVSGANITFWPPLVWTFSNQPQMYYKRASSASNNYVQNAGVEDMCLRNVNPDTTSYYNLYFNRCAYCWAKNLRTENAATSHIEILNSFRLEVRHCTLSNSVNLAASYGYGLDLEYQTCSSLIEDNIFIKTRDFVKTDSGSSGNAVLFNYQTNALANPAAPSFQGHTGGAHSAHPMMNLFEGNITYRPAFDFYWGSSSHQTIARNWFRGPMPYAAQMGCAILIDQSVSYYNVVGNVLGSKSINSNPNWTTRYSTRVSPAAMAYDHVYSTIRFGYFSDGDCGGGNNAATQWANTIVAGNYDYVAGAQTWYNPTTPQTVPASYFYSSKPAYFGNLAWPPIDPVTPTVGETVIPAGYRYAYGIDPPAGSGGNQPPVANASAAPTSGVAPLTVAFSSSGSSDPEGAALTYNWTFGDGATSTAANPSHTYSSAGTYSVQLTVSDGTNSASSGVLTIAATAATNRPPVAAASATPTSGAAPLTVAFSSAGSSDPEGAALTYNWAFGDGATSSAANPSHTYSSAGAYSAQLKVSDGTNTVSSSVLAITASSPVSTGPVAAYGFEDGSGSTVTDLSGNGNTGTITGATWTTGRYGRALAFAGTNAVVVVNDSASLDLTNALTLEAWVYPTAFNGDFQPVLIKPMDAAFSGISYALQGASRSTQMPSLGVSPSSSNLSGTSVLPLNTWSHLAATYDGTTMRLYVNGTQVASRAQTGAITSSTQPLRIGMNWGGRIDEVRIYNRALSVAEVQTDMSASVAPRPPAPTGLHVLGL